MILRPIQNDDHERALQAIATLQASSRGTPGNNAFDVLVALVRAYENKRRTDPPGRLGVTIERLIASGGAARESFERAVGGSAALDTSVLLHAESGFDRGERMSRTIDALTVELGRGARASSPLRGPASTAPRRFPTRSTS